MQMDDILKAAIQDAGLEFFNTTTTYSSPSSNSSESSLNNLGLDDDFNLTDLDWNLLDNSEESPPTSISPSQCSIQSPAVLSIHNTNNDTCQSIADDTDPFILALQELDDHNIKLDHVSTPPYFENNNQYNNSNKQYLNKQESSIKTITKPEPIKPEILSTKKDCLINKHENKKIEILNKPHTKIVKFNSSSSKTNVTKILPNAKGSDLLSLINYRATSIVNKPNSQSSKVGQVSPLVKVTKVTATVPKTNKSVQLGMQPPKSIHFTISKPVISSSNNDANNNNNNLTNTSRSPASLVNPIKVINLSQIQQKNLQEKIGTNKLNHKIIQISTNQSTTGMVSRIIPPPSSNLNEATSTVNTNVNGNNVKITKVVSSRPSFSTSNPNVFYLNKNKVPINPSSASDAKPQSSVYLTNKNQTYFNQQPPTMRLLGNTNTSQFVTKTGNSNNFSNNKIPRFYTTSPKIISAQYLNNQVNSQSSNNQSAISSNSTSTSNHHINILNSNINRYLNESKLGTLPSITNTKNINSSSLAVNTSSPAPLNSRYLTNINNNISGNLTNSNIGSNIQMNNNTQNMPASGINNLTNSFNNYFTEQDEDVVVDEEEELGHAETYANYMPSKLQIGLRHPDPIVETSSLASVEPPEVWYELAMPESVYETGALSALQIEAIVYSCQKHADFLPNNHRCGFLIGDGAGVGKGRTIAGIIYENYLLGRKKALWLSVSNDLKYDAERDFNDIGATQLEVHSLNKLKYSKISSKQNAKIKKGVIFSTYSSLIGESQHKTTKKKYSSRLKQLLQWLGGESFDGLIVFDECHKAKNLVPNGSAKPTKTGLAVLELQEKLPNARIVYASATGASEPKNMAYMVRLGLWGNGTPFADFNDFIQSIEKRGVGAMEIVAMDMKLRGMYMARQLSFSGVTFKIEEIPLKKEYVRMYNDAVKLWVEMKEKFQDAIELIDNEGRLKKTVWGQFWSSHQRFFKYLCMACKVPRVVDLAQKALRSKKCVVIGLQSTGEARTMEQLDEFGEINDFISTARGVLQNLVEKHFPTVESLSNSSNSNVSSILTAEMKQILESKKLKNKDSKNIQKVNDILHRLSSYTNKTNESSSKLNEAKSHLKISKSKKKRRKSLRSSSVSSLSSLGSSFGSLSSSDLKSELDNSENSCDENFSQFESSYDEHEPEDDDPFKIHETCNHDLEEFNDYSTSKNEPNDSGYSTNSYKPKNESLKFENFFEMPSLTSNSKENNAFESDDSDSLFSITKSVSVQSLMNRNSIGNNRQGMNTMSNTSGGERKRNLNRNAGDKSNRKRKVKKVKSKQNCLFGNDEDEEDDDDDDLDEKNISLIDEDLNCFIKKEEQILTSSDDDLKLPSKRIRSLSEAFDVNNDPISNKVSNFKNDKDDELLISPSFLQKQATKLKPTKPHEILDYMCEMKRDLLNSIRQLGKRLPANTLDELIDLLDGPESVAEMTGRKGRIVQRANTNDLSGNLQTNQSNYVYETRNETDVPVELMNVAQKEKFMNGQKLVAIISEAASSGISLQANRRNNNQFRRVHITIELPWSADRAIQQFGRTHRSNQVSAPEYVFLISELAGEKRFASTVAKRLESLGALTHGDRRATESRDLSRFNIDNKYGRAALENVIKSICNLEKPMARLPKKYNGHFMNDAREALHGVGMIICNKNGLSAYPDKDYNNINKFLNRLLGVPVELQNNIFQFFSDVLAAVILEAKRTGKWDMGILDLGSNNEVVFRKDTKFFVLDAKFESSRRVEMHTVLVERGLTWDKALDIYKKSIDNYEDNIENESKQNKKPQGFYISNQVKNNHHIAILAIPFVPTLPTALINNNEPSKITDCKFLAIYRPNTGLQVRQETPETLLKKYKRVSPTEAKSHWNEQFVKSAQQCTHVYRQAHCVNIRNCEVGLRTRRFHILAGSVLTVWNKVENLLSSLTGSSQFRLQIIRVKTNDNQKIVGCVIPTMCLKQIDALLNSMSGQIYMQNHTNKPAENNSGVNLKLEDSCLTAKEQRKVTSAKHNNFGMANHVFNKCAATPVVSSATKMKNSIYKINNVNTCSNNINGVIDFDKNFENINYDFT